MPDETSGSEKVSPGATPEIPKQTDAAKTPEQVRTDEVIDAARDAVARDLPQPVLEDVASGGVPGDVERPGWKPQSFETSTGYDPSKDPMVIAAGNDYNPRRFLDVPMGSEARKAIQNIVDTKAGEAARLSTNIEAVAQQKGSSSAETPAITEPKVITPEAAELLDKLDKGASAPAFISGQLERIASDNGINTTGSTQPEDVIAALRGMTRQTETVARTEIPDGEASESESGSAPTNPVDVETTEATSPIAEMPVDLAEPIVEPAAAAEPEVPPAATSPADVDTPDDDVDFSALNPIGAEATPVAAEAPFETPEPTPEPAAKPADETIGGEAPPTEDAEHAAGGGSVETPPDGGADAANIRAGVEFTMANRRAIADELRALPQDELVAQIEDSTERTQTLRDMLNIQRLTAEQRAEIMNDWQQTNDRLQVLRRVQRERTRGGVTGSEDESRRKARTEAQETARINNLPFSQLEGERDSAVAFRKALEESKRAEEARPVAERDLKKIKAINDELSDAKARETILNATFEAKKAEKDVKDKEEKGKKDTEQYDEQRLTSASSDELDKELGDLRGKLNPIEKRIQEINKKLASRSLSEEERKNLLEEKGGLLPTAVELQEKVGRLDEAVVKAREREAQQVKPGEKGRFEVLKNISSKEWDAMTDEQRANTLKQLAGEKGFLTAAQFEKVRDKINNGEDLSIEQRARFAKELSDRLIQFGRRGFDMKELERMKVQYPDIYDATMDRYFASKEAQQQLKEAFPTNWQKMLKFAKGKGWLIGLLIVLGGSTVVAAGKAAHRLDDSERQF